MRISDWSSDVCSSDLPHLLEPRLALGIAQAAAKLGQDAVQFILAVHPRLKQAAFASREILVDRIAQRHIFGTQRNRRIEGEGRAVVVVEFDENRWHALADLGDRKSTRLNSSH